MQLDEQRAEIAWQFASLGDYLWKLPDFLVGQRVEEARRLDAYFPAEYHGEDADLVRRQRRLRSDHEDQKLSTDFPAFMASSSFIHLVSVFEYYLLAMCRTLERCGGADLDCFRGGRRGAARLLSYAAACCGDALHPDDLTIMRDVIVLRNCMAHANGMVDEFTDGARVRDIVRKRTCYRPERTGGQHRGERGDHEPAIIEEVLGERLLVPLKFSHWLAALARNVLLAICNGAERVASDSAFRTVS